MNKIKKIVVAIAATFLVGLPLVQTTNVTVEHNAIQVSQSIKKVEAVKGDYGVDWSKYQGNLGKFGYTKDRFSICQLGGYYNGQFVVQSTYATQVQYTIAQGKRAHTYLYSQFSNNAEADQMLNYYLPKVQTPKGSIVALDVESGTPSTSSIIYAMNRIKAAGYTPILYSSDSFIKAHVDYKAVLQQFPNSLWIARYPDYQVRSTERTQSLPVIDGMAIVQFTSTYVAGGLDGNKDYLGVTDNGYNGTISSDQGGTAVKPDTSTPAISAGQEANSTPKKDIVAGDTVKVNFSANKWATGQSIPSWVKGVAHKVLQVSGNRVLLDGVLSWANKSDVEILSVGSPVTTSTATNKATNSTGTFNDSGYTIHRQSSTFTAHQTLRVFAYPGVKATGARYYPGESVKYDGYVRNGNYIYVSYLIKGGYHHYVAVRHNGVALGSFK